METKQTRRGLRITRATSTVLEDVSCGSCPGCSAGRDYWCSQPTASGVALGTVAAAAPTAWVRGWVTALGALADAGAAASDAVLVLTDRPSERAVELVRTLHPGPVLASSGRDTATRAALAAVSASGRAQVVIALREARTAVRSVQRGGTVCLPDADVAAPSVTELVQRDVRLRGPSSIRALSTLGAWPAVLAGLDALWLVEAPTAAAGVTDSQAAR